MRHDSGPARALLFVADLTSREQFLAAFGPYATASSILVVTHRSELPEIGDRLVFRIALADGETMLAGEALVTSNRGTGRRGVVRLEPRWRDAGSRATHADLIARARSPRGGDSMDEAMDRLAECFVLEEAQAIGEIDAGAPVAGAEASPAAPLITVAVDEEQVEPEPLAPWRNHHRRRAVGRAIGAAACGAALIALAVVMSMGEPERAGTAAAAPAATDRVTLHLTSSPPGARFRVNGEEVGPSPTSIRVPPGSTAIVDADFGGRIWQRRIAIASDQPAMSVRAVLGE